MAAISRRIVIAQSLYAIGAALRVFNTWHSLGVIVLAQLNYAITPRLGVLARLGAEAAVVTSDDLGHSVTEMVTAPAEAALRFLSDGARLGMWAFGCWNTVAQADGLFLGTSLFDGAKLWVRVESDAARMCVTFHVGAAPDRLVPRILAFVVPGQRVGRPAETCLVTLLAWRDAAMDSERWRRLTTGHAAEILLLRSFIERDTHSPSP